ncbi:hypothetical protein EDD86DRAFT_275403, partial [Gorgonomyces haynaldii]
MPLGKTEAITLLQWCCTNGGRLNFNISDDGHLIASKDIYPGQELCFYPGAILLSESVVQSSPVAKAITWAVLQHLEAEDVMSHKGLYKDGLKYVCMAAFLIYELYENDESPWKPLLAHLQRELPTPLFWSRDTVSRLLAGTILEEETLKRWEWIDSVCRFVSLVSGHLFHRNSWTLENFKWALGTIFGRYGFEHSICLFPLLDHLVHSNHKLNITQAGDGISFVSDTLLPNGSVLGFDYGNHSNEFYLSKFGFVVKDNPNDRCLVRMMLSDLDPWLEERKLIMYKNGISLEHRLRMKPLCSTFLQASRVFVANTMDIQKLEDDDTHKILEPLGLHNELHAIDHMYWILHERKQTLLQHTMTHDQGDRQYEMALIYRKGQIRVLDSQIQLLKVYGRQLLQPQSERLFFTLESDLIDDTLKTLVMQMNVSSDVAMCLMALSTDLPWPKFDQMERVDILRDQFDDYCDYFKDTLLPMLDSSMFPPKTFHLDSLLNMKCVYHLYHGSYDRLNWLGLSQSGIYICHSDRRLSNKGIS